METLNDIKQLFHMTLILMFNKHWRTVCIFLCLALGFFGWGNILLFIVVSVCAQVMYLQNIDKRELVRMCKLTCHILLPVAILTTIVISVAMYWGPAGEPPSEVVIETMNSIHTTMLGIAMCLLSGAIIVNTYSEYVSFDRGFNVVFGTLLRKPESRIPFVLISGIEIAFIILELTFYVGVPLMVSWVLMYVYDMRVLRKSKQKSKSGVDKFIPALQN
jgi:multisubunit Na+/H+ antiporter MnhC subunit